jgi:hypothetical protein
MIGQSRVTEEVPVAFDDEISMDSQAIAGAKSETVEKPVAMN